jgi:hypothetical protein
MMEEKNKLPRLLAEVCELVSKYPHLEPDAAAGMARILNRGQGSTSPNRESGEEKLMKFTRCQAFMDIRDKLKSLGRTKMDIKDFRQLTHGLLMSAGIPDDNPSIRESERYRKLDANWPVLRMAMLEVVEQWHNAMS